MVAGMVQALGGAAGGLVFPLQLGAIGLAAVALWRSRGDSRSDAALMLVAVVLASPLAWRANFVLAAPALVLVAAWPDRSRVRWALVTGLLLVGLVMSEPVLGHERLREVLLFRPFGAVYLLLAGWLVSRRVGSVHAPGESEERHHRRTANSNLHSASFSHAETKPPAFSARRDPSASSSPPPPTSSRPLRASAPGLPQPPSDCRGPAVPARASRICFLRTGS